MSKLQLFEYKLKDISSFVYGRMPDKTKILEKGYPIFSGYRVVGYYPEFMYEREKLLIIARGVGGTGDMKLSPPLSYITNLSIVFNENESLVDYRYLYYCLSNLNMKNLDTGSCQSQITINQLEEYKVLLPELSKQKQISKILSTLERKIELNNRINCELEQMAKLLYDYWFVQFDFPDANGKPYKSSGGKMVWNKELKREIPEEWEAGNLLNLGEIIGGSTPPREISEYFTNEGTAWITPKDLSLNVGKKFITKGEIDVSDSGIKVASLNIMPKGTILLSSRAPIGYLAISREKVTTNQGFKSFVPNKGFSTEFVYYTVKNMIPAIENNAAGSTFKEVSASTLKFIPVCLPNKTVINKYTKLANKIFTKQDLLELENHHLTTLRDWLLPMLMNGQVRVGEAGNKEYQANEAEMDLAAEPGD